MNLDTHKLHSIIVGTENVEFKQKEFNFKDGKVVLLCLFIDTFVTHPVRIKLAERNRNKPSKSIS